MKSPKFICLILIPVRLLYGDANLARLRFLSLRKGHSKHAIFVGGGYPICLDGFRSSSERLSETASSGRVLSAVTFRFAAIVR